MALSKITQDHKQIRNWAEARGAKPAEVAHTEHNGDVGIIRLEFPEAPHAKVGALKEISWDEFFEKFDASGLAFTYQNESADGEPSNFNKLIYLEEPKTPARRTAARKSRRPSSSSSPKKTASKPPGSSKSPKRPT